MRNLLIAVLLAVFAVGCSDSTTEPVEKEVVGHILHREVILKIWVESGPLNPEEYSYYEIVKKFQIVKADSVTPWPGKSMTSYAEPSGALDFNIGQGSEWIMTSGASDQDGYLYRAVRTDRSGRWCIPSTVDKPDIKAVCTWF